MSRYGNNIKRIAETGELKDKIRQAEGRLDFKEKAPIPGARAIAYPNGTVQAGSPGETKPNKNGSPDPKEPTDEDITDEGGKDGEGTDADDLINGTRTLTKGEDPGKIEVKDCETGEPIDLILNAGANEGEAKFQHPDGFSIYGASENAEGYDDWQLGYYWRHGTPPNHYDAPTPEVGTIAMNLGYYNPDYDFRITDVRILFVTRNDLTHAIVNAQVYREYYSFPPNTGWVTIQAPWTRQSCAGETGTARCITAIPSGYPTWQDKDPGYHHQLAFSAADGGFVSSSKDKNIPAKFRNDVGQGVGLNNLSLCTMDDKEVIMSVLRDGTFAFFEQDGFGQPKEDAKILHFDKEGKYLDILQESEYNYGRLPNNPFA